MDRGLVFQVVFAAGVVVVAGAILAAARGSLGPRLATGVAALVGAGATAAWVAFALHPTVGLAVSAGGLTAAAAAVIALRRARTLLEHVRRVDEYLARAEQRLHEAVEVELAERGVELEHAVARARADSTSLLVEEERRISEQRRGEFAKREEDATAKLTEALAATQQRVEQRLAEWAADLDRAQQAYALQISRLGERQRQLIAEAEARIAANAERLEAESEQQRAAVTRLREDLARTAKDVATASAGELEASQAERRRALHELNDRLRRRERALAEQVEREEAEAAGRLHASFADVERRQLEQVERAVARTAASYVDAAGQQFADAIRSQREDAARRLARELDRGVQAFAREAEKVLAERLAQVGDAGAQRFEKRLSGVTSGLERQRDEYVASLEQRLVDTEADLRRRVQTLVAETESERAVLDTRLGELSRRLDETVARAQEQLAALAGRPA